MNFSRFIFFISISFFVFRFSVCAQDSKIDSLKSVYEAESDPKKKVDLLNVQFNYQFPTDYEKGLEFAIQALKEAKQLEGTEAAIKNRISESANNVGACYYMLDNYENALKYLLMALQAAEQIQDTNRMANALYNLSNLYDKKDINKGFEYLERAIALYEGKGDLEMAANGYANMATHYFFLPDYDKAMVYYDKTIKIAEELNLLDIKSILYENRAVGLKKMKRYEEALVYHLKAIEIDHELNNKQGLVTSYLNTADLYIKMNQGREAQEYNQKSLDFAKELGLTENIMLAYQGLAESARIRGNTIETLSFTELYANWKDSLYDQENAKAIAEMQTKYDTEKKEAENKLLKTEKERDHAEIKQKAFQQKILLIGLIVVIIVVIYVAYSLMQKKKTNKLLNEQNRIIEEKNKDITDSINYAQRIQNAILPGEKALANHFESFIYYKPKDIVSGDFYWVKEMGEKIFFSVVDCTGHGVPGAFMSIIGFNSLNRIVDDLEITDTGLILDKLNDLVIESIAKESTDGRIIRDGMDLSFCCYDKKNKTIQYSGAHNSLYIVSPNKTIGDGIEPSMEENGLSLFELKADKMAIGGTHNENKYLTHNIQLNENDTLYLFSDGYADQFGGPKGKKFMYKRFKELILSIQNDNMPNQHQILDKTITDWRGELDQLDDICVMGIRV